jgi:hypothetical protein
MSDNVGANAPGNMGTISKEQDDATEALVRALCGARARARRLECALAVLGEARQHREAVAGAAVFPGDDKGGIPLLVDRACASHRYAMHLANAALVTHE